MSPCRFFHAPVKIKHSCRYISVQTRRRQPDLELECFSRKYLVAAVKLTKVAQMLVARNPRPCGGPRKALARQVSARNKRQVECTPAAARHVPPEDEIDASIKHVGI
eukprot:6173192-Pleurochrysis_carterae.AAC.4